MNFSERELLELSKTGKLLSYLYDWFIKVIGTKEGYGRESDGINPDTLKPYEIQTLR